MKTPEFGELAEMAKSVLGKVGEGTGKGVSTLKGVESLIGKVSETAQGLAEQAESLATLHDEAHAALARMQEWDKSLKSKLEKAHGYAVFPSIGRASLVLGITYGKGEVFEQNHVIGFAGTVQITIGVQLGGETLHELVIFEDKQALDRFKSGKISFAANASVALVKGAAAATNNPNGFRVFIYNEGGEMLELGDIGGQTFRFVSAGPLAKLNRAGQNAAGQNPTGQNAAGQNAAGQNAAGQNPTGQNAANTSATSTKVEPPTTAQVNSSTDKGD